MSQALQYIYDIWSAFITFIFNDALIFPNVSIGWVLVSIFVLSVLIRNIIAIPRRGQNINLRGDKDDS